MSRQKIVGWLLIVVSGLFIAYFVRIRLLTPGPPVEKKEWLNLIACVVLLMVGTMNVRLAAMRERNRSNAACKDIRIDRSRSENP
jgi:hypothetical protein